MYKLKTRDYLILITFYIYFCTISASFMKFRVCDSSDILNQFLLKLVHETLNIVILSQPFEVLPLYSYLDIVIPD